MSCDLQFDQNIWFFWIQGRHQISPSLIFCILEESLGCIGKSANTSFQFIQYVFFGFVLTSRSCHHLHISRCWFISHYTSPHMHIILVDTCASFDSRYMMLYSDHEILHFGTHMQVLNFNYIKPDSITKCLSFSSSSMCIMWRTIQNYWSKHDNNNKRWTNLRVVPLRRNLRFFTRRGHTAVREINFSERIRLRLQPSTTPCTIQLWSRIKH